MNYAPKYPTIEKRVCEKVKKCRERFYVVGVPGFEGAQLYGFKSESSLMRCYRWWYNNSYLKGKPAKEAKREWKDNGKENFYHRPTSDIFPSHTTEIDGNYVPAWLD